jgi:N-acetylmuramoyl-L-alanine amidase
MEIKRKSWWSIACLFAITIFAIVGYSHLSVAQVPSTALAFQPNVCAASIYPIRDMDLSTSPVGEVLSELGIARTGAHDDCQRVTPLPRGTRARIVGQAQGPNRYKKMVPWYQLDYGAWIEASEVTILNTPSETKAIANSLQVRENGDRTEVIIPLSAPVPLEIQQQERAFNITLHNTIGKIDRLDLPAMADKSETKTWTGNKTVNLERGIIANANWQSLNSDRVQINLQLRSPQQWGYQMAYRGNNLVISLRQPPQLSRNPQQPLQGLTIAVDAGHGAIDSGAVGRAYGNTYLEKTVNIQLSTYLQQELQKRGAKVVMTRTTDINPSLDERQAIINRTQPVVSISIHHDAGTPGRTEGASIYWYHPQSQNFADFLLHYFSEKGDRPILNNNGVIQRSFALARPSIAPAVLLEVGFMTNPREISDLARSERQQQLANVLADGITQWIATRI